MNIREKLSEISQYFINKLIDGEFEFVKCDKFNATVKIDGEFVFELWIANNPPECFHFHGVATNMTFLNGQDFIEFESQEQRVKAWENIRPFVKKYQQDEIYQTKLKELKELEEDMKKL